jgi:hypothetical protein
MAEPTFTVEERITKGARAADDLRKLCEKYPPETGAWRPSSCGTVKTDEKGESWFILQDFDSVCYVVTVRTVGT